MVKDRPKKTHKKTTTKIVPDSKSGSSNTRELSEDTGGGGGRTSTRFPRETQSKRKGDTGDVGLV